MNAIRVRRRQGRQNLACERRRISAAGSLPQHHDESHRGRAGRCITGKPGITRRCSRLARDRQIPRLRILRRTKSDCVFETVENGFESRVAVQFAERELAVGLREFHRSRTNLILSDGLQLPPLQRSDVAHMVRINSESHQCPRERAFRKIRREVHEKIVAGIGQRRGSVRSRGERRVSTCQVSPSDTQLSKAGEMRDRWQSARFQ